MIGHLVRGARIPGGPGFEVPVHGGTRTFSRARALELELAAQSLVPGEPPPREVLERAAALMDGDGLWRRDLAAALDVAVSELPARLVDVELALAGLSHRRSQVTTFLQAHWTDGAGELGRRLLAPLASGAAVLLSSDRRVPDAADAWADALLDAGLAPERLALVHGLAPEVAWSSPATPERARFSVDDAAASERLGPPQRGRRWAVDWPRACTLVAGSKECPTPESAFELAFGARSALGGQLDGRLGVLEVDGRAHTHWVEALIALGDRTTRELATGAHPLPRAVDREMERRFEAVLQRLLEQGATPVVAAERHGAPVFGPALFVNGEPWMDALRSLPCVPVLVLRRV